MRTALTAGGVAASLLFGGCSGAEGSDRTVVASFYPLAFAAERIAGPDWNVVDLTPPGAEAHDVELSIQDRAALEDADVVVYLGDVGFQPQVENAVRDASGRVVAAAEGIELMESEHQEGTLDPHVWLDPVLFARIADRVAQGMAAADPGGEQGFRGRAEDVRDRLEALDNHYRETLRGCRFRVMIVSHEAFGYLAERYGLDQVGLAGVEPEGEPTAGRLGEAGELLADGRAGAVFYEAGPEAERIAESVAADAAVPALPLGTLESRPTAGSYLTVMEDNLRSLREGLGCP